MRTLTKSTCCAFATVLLAANANAGFLFGVNLGQGSGEVENLIKIDLSDNSVTTVGPDLTHPSVFNYIQSMAYNRNADLLYGYNINDDTLVSIDPDDGSIVNTVGITGFADLADINVFALGYDPNTDTLYGVNGATGLLGTRSLITIDTATGAATTIGTGFSAGNSPNPTSMDFDPNSNTLYAVGTDTDLLYTVDTTTGLLTEVGAVGGGFNGSLGLGYDYDNDILYGFEDNVDQIIIIDTATGAGTATGIFLPAGTNVRGLTYVGESGAVPGDFDGDGDVDGVDVATMFSNFNGPGGGVPTVPATDLDNDGDCDGVDVANLFGLFTGPLAPASVPEPTSLALLGMGGLLVARRRRA